MAATRARGEITPFEESSLQRVAAREVSKIMVLASPWIVGVLIHGLAAALHFILYSPESVGAWSAVVTLCVVILSAVTYVQSHARGLWGRVHTVTTTFLAGMWTVAVINTGPGHPIIWRLGVVGGITAALSWNIRSVVRMKGVDPAAAVGDPLTFLFGRGAARAGMPAIEARTIKATEHKVEGEVQLDEGRQVADDLAKKVPYIESGIGLPPGSIQTSIDPDDASKAKVTVSDPRVMKNPIPWPGPSRPGASVADPIRIGLWQHLDPMEFLLPGVHLQIMGQTGSGKSIGGAWNILAEAVTRHDVAVFAVDITKGEQTLGPLRPALHRFATTKAEWKGLLADIYPRIRERTDYLAARSLTKWVPGCGLSYWVLWVEEAADALAALSDKELDQFLSLLKIIRSAGGSVVLSLQRSDYTQMPTIARGQLAKLCFGVESAADASFGLSERQQDTCRPELWGNSQPGMAYMDVPGLPEELVTVPGRTYAWGIDEDSQFSDEAATAAMREHAAQWPASAKNVDQWTAEVARLDAGDGTALPDGGDGGGDGQGDDEDDDDDVTGVADECLETEDPDPAVQAGLDDEIPDIPEGEPPLRFAPPDVRMTPEERGQALMAHLQAMWDDGAREFSTRDLRPLWETIDMSRSWAQKALRKLVEAGVLGYDDDRYTYLMPERPEA